MAHKFIRKSSNPYVNQWERIGPKRPGGFWGLCLDPGLSVRRGCRAWGDLGFGAFLPLLESLLQGI